MTGLDEGVLGGFVELEAGIVGPRHGEAGSPVGALSKGERTER